MYRCFQTLAACDEAKHQFPAVKTACRINIGALQVGRRYYNGMHARRRMQTRDSCELPPTPPVSLALRMSRPLSLNMLPFAPFLCDSSPAASSLPVAPAAGSCKALGSICLHMQQLCVACEQAVYHETVCRSKSNFALQQHKQAQGLPSEAQSVTHAIGPCACTSPTTMPRLLESLHAHQASKTCAVQYLTTSKTRLTPASSQLAA